MWYPLRHVSSSVVDIVLTLMPGSGTPSESVTALRVLPGARIDRGPSAPVGASQAARAARTTTAADAFSTRERTRDMNPPGPRLDWSGLQERTVPSYRL